MREPFAGHLRTVLHLVEGGIVDRRQRREVQHDNRHFGPAHHRQDSGGKRIGRNMKKDQIDVGLAEGMSRATALSAVSIMPRFTTSAPEDSSSAAISRL